MADTSRRPKRPPRSKARKPGSLKALKLRLWRAILDAEALREDTQDENVKLRAIHALAQVSGAYLKCFEVADLEGRFTALEQKMLIGQDDEF